MLAPGLRLALDLVPDLGVGEPARAGCGSFGSVAAGGTEVVPAGRIDTGLVPAGSIVFGEVPAGRSTGCSAGSLGTGSTGPGPGFEYMPYCQRVLGAFLAFRWCRSAGNWGVFRIEERGEAWLGLGS